MNPIQDVPYDCFRVSFNDLTFPFPYIPQNLILPTISQDVGTSTGKRGFSSSVRLTESLPGLGHGLNRLLLSHKLFRNLIAYADPHRKLDDKNLDISTLSIVLHHLTEASGAAVFKAIDSMQAESAAIAKRPQALSNSQLTTQNEVTKVVILLTHCAIRQRYSSEDEHGLPIPHANIPRWRGNTLKVDFRNIAGANASPAGLSDAILDIGTGETRAILHCKPSWVYTDEHLAGTSVGGRLQNDDGTFNYNDNTNRGSLVKQLWCSLVAMNCRYIVWTNGSKIFFAVKIGDNLICSPPQEWAQRDTARAIIGLTFAALDHSQWNNIPEPIDLPNTLVGQTVVIANH